MFDLSSWAELLESGTDLTPAEIQALRARLLPAVAALRAREWRLGAFYYSTRVVVTAGGLLVPSLVSLQNPGGAPTSIDEGGGGGLRWSLWLVGLTTSLCTALVSVFSADRLYFACREQLECLDTEAWLYLARAGRYRRHVADDVGHRGDAHALFVERCEATLHRASRDGGGGARPPRPAIGEAVVQVAPPPSATRSSFFASS